MLNLRGYDEANLKTGKKLQANWYYTGYKLSEFHPTALLNIEGKLFFQSNF